MKHIISVLVENKFGVLSRVSGLFSGRGFNIETISVGPTLDPSISQMTIVTTGDERILEQIVKQLNKLIDVIKVTDLAEKEFVEREMCLIKVNAPAEHRAEALRIADRKKNGTFLSASGEKTHRQGCNDKEPQFFSVSHSPHPSTGTHLFPCYSDFAGAHDLLDADGTKKLDHG